MLGYIIAIVAVIVVVPLVFLLLRSGPGPERTQLKETEGSGGLRSEPAEEQATSVDDESSTSRPSPD